MSFLSIRIGLQGQAHRLSKDGGSCPVDAEKGRGVTAACCASGCSTWRRTSGLGSPCSFFARWGKTILRGDKGFPSLGV